MKNQICTILGGGGFIGRYLVRNLTKKNYRCIITTRKAFQKGYLKTQATPGAIELLDWNPNNFSDLKEAIKNSDFVINLIGILFENRKQKFYNIHAKIPEAVAKICAESDVKKFIQVSAIGANEKSNLHNFRWWRFYREISCSKFDQEKLQRHHINKKTL